MDLKLKNKKVLITGGSKGIGLACARVFLDEGAHVAIASRKVANLKQAQRQLKKHVNLTTFESDLSRESDAEELAGKLKSHYGGLDILVNSAGAARQAPAEELTMASWREAMEAKYFAYMFAIQAILPLMKKKQSGVIVNIIGQGGKFPLPFHLAGGAANAALMLTTSGLAKVSGKDGIRVNGVNPGYIKTERLKHILEAKGRDGEIKPRNVESEITRDIPMARMGSAEDVANIVAFLASPRSTYITGVNVPIDGGLFLAI